jgi:hypothetical protein
MEHVVIFLQTSFASIFNSFSVHRVFQIGLLQLCQSTHQKERKVGPCPNEKTEMGLFHH